MSTSPRTVSMTKEQLRTALIQRGVPVPAVTAKKEEFQRLYEEKVLPIQSQSEFSSDDEQDSAPVNGDMQSLPLLNKVWKDNGECEQFVRKLTNEHLYQHLHHFNVSIGPVVATTRLLYEQQLIARLLESKVVAKRTETDTNGHNSNGDEHKNSRNGFSDSDDDATVETASQASRSSRTSNVTGNKSPRRRGRPSSTASTLSTHSSVQDNLDNDSHSSTSSGATNRRLQRGSETLRNLFETREEDGSGDAPSGLEPVINIRSRTSTSTTNSSYRSALDSGANSGVSYFKERPGYSSMTTSNILPRKPTAKLVDDDAQFKEHRNKNWYALLGGGLFIILVLALGLYFMSASDMQEFEHDELDQVLAELAQEERRLKQN